MTNNDVLRRFRYALELDNERLLACFRESNVELTLAELAALLKTEEEPGFCALSDQRLGQLLDGFVALKRGRREPEPGPLESSAIAPQPGASEAPPELSNNRILRAIKIGLGLRDTDVLAIMELASTPVSKTELSALFRREDHRNYQPCGNQFLRNFLKGLALWHRSRSTMR
ncbi:MAG: hypothetical protein JWN48_3057 [Myxococcaceae bacterium]|nr:hypothetical protein [Myxococcaceae bacterium]